MPARPALATPPPRMSVSECCRQLGISRDTFYAHRLGDVFTRFESPGGRPKVCDQELTEYKAFPNAARARAAVLALRKRLGRIA